MSAPNRKRGEGSIGDCAILVNHNSLCSLETALGVNMPEPLVMMTNGLGYKDLRTFIRVFAVEPLSDEEVGLLIDEVGQSEALHEITQALDGYFAPKKEQPENPRKAA